MKHHTAKPARMLIAMVGRRKGDALVSVAKAAGGRGGTITLGKSLGSSRLLRALSLADIQVDVVFIAMADEADAVLKAVRQAAEHEKKLRGSAVLVELPELFVRKSVPARDNASAPQGAETRSERMESGYKLISVIVNSGYGDDVMAAARKAGASGGTLLNAHGTGTEDDVKFFGITLVPEKDMLLIVAEQDKVKAIVEAIGTVPTLNEPGGGVIFTQNVEEFIVLGS